MYRIVDLQIQGRYYAYGQIFKTKKEVVEALAGFHDIDFLGTDDKDNELDIWEYFKFWKINTTQKQLDWLLEYGQWELKKVKKEEL